MSECEMKGYTTGVFDLFHIGHLNLLQKARERCEHLVVGVSTDGLVESLKGRRPIIPFEERMAIVASVRYVDEVVAEEHDDKLTAWETVRFHRIFKGDDWRGTNKWNALEQEFSHRGVEVIYFPYTTTTSSTLIRKILETF